MCPDQDSNKLGRFLRARRAQLTPEQVGLPASPGIRSTPGLRREELATLAGLSIDYYTRLERGKELRPSPAVVDSLAHALRLEREEHEHLRVLAARSVSEPSTVPSRSVRPGVKLMLEKLRPCPAYVLSRTLDVLAANPGGLRLYTGIDNWPVQQRNLVRYYFLHPAARDLFPEREARIRSSVARLWALADSDPDAPDLVQLVGELLVKSDDFARLWERYDVRPHRLGNEHIRHPHVGDLTLDHQSMQLEGTPGHRLVAHYADLASPDHDAMVLLDMLGAQDASDSAGKSCDAGP